MPKECSSSQRAVVADGMGELGGRPRTSPVKFPFKFPVKFLVKFSGIARLRLLLLLLLLVVLLSTGDPIPPTTVVRFSLTLPLTARGSTDADVAKD